MSPSTALIRTGWKLRSTESQPESAQNLRARGSSQLDVLRVPHTDGTLARRGPGLTLRQFVKGGGKVIEYGVDKILRRFGSGAERLKLSIKKFFGEDDERQAVLDDLHTVLQRASRDRLSRQHKDLWDDCHQLLEYARESRSVATQLYTFKILVSLITRYPGLRRRLCDHKDVRNKSEAEIADFWLRVEGELCGEEWMFYREFAAFCISDSGLAKLVEAANPSELAVVKLEEGNLNKVPIEELLGWCRAGPGFEPPRLCSIRYVAGILELPSFWKKGGPDEERFLVVLSDISGTVFQLLCETEAKATDPSIDISPSMSAAREALDMLCTTTLNGLLRLNSYDALPRDSPMQLGEMLSLLMSGDDIKACFPSASAVASSVRALLATSTAPPDAESDNETETDRASSTHSGSAQAIARTSSSQDPTPELHSVVSRALSPSPHPTVSATRGDSTRQGSFDESDRDGALIERDDSPGQQFLEEELYKLRQKPRGSNSRLSHHSWEIARDDEPDYDENYGDRSSPRMPLIPDSEQDRDGALIEHDDSPGQQFLEEELYKLRQKPRGSNSRLSHHSWEIARDDEPDYDENYGDRSSPRMPLIPDSEQDRYVPEEALPNPTP